MLSSYITRYSEKEGANMGFQTKVQLIKRKSSEQWYINFPSAVAQAMEFSKGEVVEWIVEDKSQLVLNRKNPPPSAIKKNRSGHHRKLRPTLGAGGAKLQAGKGKPKGEKAGAEFAGLSGTAYLDRTNERGRAPVRGLERGLPDVLKAALCNRRRLRGDSGGCFGTTVG